jgi:hypothetical protein
MMSGASYFHQTRNPTLRKSNKFKMCNEHKCSPILKITVQSNSQKWLRDDKPHTLGGTNQICYKALGISFQSVWADHSPILEHRTHQQWVTWEQNMLILNTI